MIDYGLSVYLAPLDLVYCDTLFKWRNDYRIRRYCRQNDLLSWQKHGEWIKTQGDNNSEKMYLVRRKSDRTVVGVAGLTNLDLLNRRAEFSLYIGPEFHSKGYGNEALQVLLNHGFSAYGLESIWGETFSFNPAIEMFEKVGLKKEGVRRNFYFREGAFCDAILYSILKSEWELMREKCFGS